MKKPLSLLSAILGLTSAISLPIPFSKSSKIKLPTPDIRVDTNRDGIVDISSTSADIPGKNTWTTTRGAIFIANIGFSGGSPEDCSVENYQSVYCNDASGRNVVGTSWEYLARIRTVPVNIDSEIDGQIVGRVEALGIGKGFVRLFYTEGLGQGGNSARVEWKRITEETIFNAAQLQKGLELGIDGIMPNPDSRLWDGTVTVQFTISRFKGINEEEEADAVHDTALLRIAPVLTHHHLQKAQRILTFSGNETHNPDQVHFVNSLQKYVAEAGISEPLHLFNHSDDPWTQDFFEPGYTSLPGPDGKPKVLRVMIRSPQPTRASGGQIMKELVGRGVGIWETSDGSRSEINSMGNLETIPPYRHQGRNYPAGRIIMGTWRHEQPAWGLVNFLRTQEVQDPLFLDTDWLRAGHVDEFLQFLPAPKFKKSGKKKHSSSTNPRPWILAVADPHLALSLLHSAQVSGHGHQKLSSRPRQTFPGAPLAAIPQDTINQFLSNPYNTHINTYCATRIARNLHRLKRETGLTDDEIIRLPVLFENDQEFFFINYNVTKFFGGDVLAPIGPSVFSRDIVMAGSYLPNAINGVLLSEEKVVVPKQWGPLVGGKDIFEEEVRRVYGGVGIDVGFVDDWTTHHGGGGDVHCGTNTWREAGRWWE